MLLPFLHNVQAWHFSAPPWLWWLTLGIPCYQDCSSPMPPKKCLLTFYVMFRLISNSIDDIQHLNYNSVETTYLCHNIMHILVARLKKVIPKIHLRDKSYQPPCTKCWLHLAVNFYEVIDIAVQRGQRGGLIHPEKCDCLSETCQ